MHVHTTRCFWSPRDECECEREQNDQVNAAQNGTARHMTLMTIACNTFAHDDLISVHHSVAQHLTLCPFVYFNFSARRSPVKSWVVLCIRMDESASRRWMCENAIFWNSEKSETKMSYQKKTKNKENKNFILTRNEMYISRLYCVVLCGCACRLQSAAR